MATATELCESYTAAARGNYERDGHLAPILSLIGSRRVHFVLGPTDDVPVLAAQVTAGFVNVIQPDFIILVSETWKREVPEEEAATVLDDYQRGELERREQSGDPSVYTALMVTVFDCKDVSRSHMTLTVDRGDHLREEFNSTGRGEGRISDLIEEALEVGRNVEPPTFDLEALGAVIAGVGWITSMVID